MRGECLILVFVYHSQISNLKSQIAHMERIIIDMDEVMADTMGAMCEWYKKTYGLPLDYSKVNNWKEIAEILL